MIWIPITDLVTHTLSKDRHCLLKQTLWTSQLSSLLWDRPPETSVGLVWLFFNSNKLNWNITISIISTMLHWHWKGVNLSFSGILWGKKKKLILSENNNMLTWIPHDNAKQLHLINFLWRRTFQSGGRYSSPYRRNTKLINPWDSYSLNKVICYMGKQNRSSKRTSM